MGFGDFYDHAQNTNWSSASGTRDPGIPHPDSGFSVPGQGLSFPGPGLKIKNRSFYTGTSGLECPGCPLQCLKSWPFDSGLGFQLIDLRRGLSLPDF